MLQTRDLRFAYPGGGALAFPDIDVPQAGVLLLEGASGSGKSTLLALCCALLKAQSGQIVVAGQDLALLEGPARDAWRGRQVGFLPQRLHLSESLSVRDNLALAFFAARLPEDDGAIRAALQALGVGDLAERKPSALSGGQAQRVALARAVLLAPRIILADEPTASLDDEAAEAAQALLHQAAQRCGATLVVATHDRRVLGGAWPAPTQPLRLRLRNSSETCLQPSSVKGSVL
jgi:putative ABC transport system ATP-binding protein